MNAIIRTATGSPLTAIACSEDYLFASGSASEILRWNKGEDYGDSRLLSIQSGITSMQCIGSSLYVGTTSEEAALRIYSHELAFQRSVPSGSGTVFDMFNDEGHLITGLADGMLRIWTLPLIECVQDIKAQEHFVLSVVADTERVYGGGIDNCTNVFSRRDGSRIATLGGHEANILSLAIDDNFVFSGSGEIWWGGPGSPRPSVFESSVRVWSKNDWECVQHLKGHEDNINSLCVDSQAVYSASDDGTVRFYWLNDWSQGVAVHLEKTRISCMCQDSDALYLGCSNGNIHILEKGLFL